MNLYGLLSFTRSFKQVAVMISDLRFDYDCYNTDIPSFRRNWAEIFIAERPLDALVGYDENPYGRILSVRSLLFRVTIPS
jgi:hypothetical protein